MTGRTSLEFIIAVHNGQTSYTKTIDTHAVRVESQFSLLDNLVDFEDYYAEIDRRATKVPIPESRLTLIDIYVSPLCSHTGDRAVHSADAKDIHTFEQSITAWITENSNRQIALLGEYGQGKSTVALNFVHDLIPQARCGLARIPLLIELRGKSPSTLQPLEFLGAWASAYRIDPMALMKLIIAGRTILIFEGFDEMAESGDLETRLKHFRALWRFCYPGSKLIITGRPNFFLDDHELRAALAIGDNSGAIPYCDPVYLHFFHEQQMASALRTMDDVTRKQIIGLSQTDQKFNEVVSRPALLHMVALLWKTYFQQIEHIDSAVIVSLFIKHLYERQASKAARERAFMSLSLAEREYFQVGIAAYMVANGLKNQILTDQFRDAIAKLYDSAPPDLYKKGQAQEPAAPTRPLAERLKDRPNALDEVETDVRTYGILVRDYSRPNAFRFPHKAFFELLFAKYVADQLVGDNLEENAAICVATGATAARIVDMPEGLSFLGELLSRRKDERSARQGEIQMLFNNIVLGGRFHMPVLITRIILIENLRVGYRMQRERGLISSIISSFMRPSAVTLLLSTLAVETAFLADVFPTFQSQEVSGNRLYDIGFLGFLTTISGFFLMYTGVAWRERIKLWGLVVRNIGYGVNDLAKIYGKTVAEYIMG